MTLMPLLPQVQWQWHLVEDARFVVSPPTEADANGVDSDITRWLCNRCWDDLAPREESSDIAVSHAQSPMGQWQAVEVLRAQNQAFFNLELQLPASVRSAAEGVPCWISLSGVPVFDGAGRRTAYRGIWRDITLEKNAQATIASLAWSDHLTGLSNRRLLLDRLHSALLGSARSQEHGALIYVDVDKFRSHNAMLGHLMADALLVELGARLATCTRATDTVARLSGDIFVVLVVALGKDPEQATQSTKTITRKIEGELSLPFEQAEPGVPVTCSMGVCIFQGSVVPVDALLDRAELALGQAKQYGGNETRYFDLGVQAQITHITQVEKELSVALQSNQLRLFYQPIVDRERKVVGFEALIRWQHPEHGLITPVQFVQIAERCGLIVPMGDWVLRAACQQLARFVGSAEMGEKSIAVNLSARQLAHPDFVANVKLILQSTGAPAERLKLEITESMLLSDIGKTIEKLHELSDLGIRLSLDDFGTGYSSLSYLKKLPLSQLKIDQSFIRDLLNDPVDAAIVRTILQLAKSLGMSVIAEGVEIEGQQKVLSTMGCKLFQGYLFGKPAPME
jgi:diguanylate cyclase (GGDEF)-like protein